MTVLARLKHKRSLLILLILFIGLALFYSVIIPIFEGPDEDDHFRYAKYLADYRAFPVQSFEPGGGTAGHQGWQPPLYYSLVALMIAPLDTSDYEQQLWRNPVFTFVGDPSCCGRNIYYHPDSQNFPWTRTTLAVHLARLLSILFGAITVAATYFIASTIFDLEHAPQNTQYARLLALACASVVAFNPTFLFASALVSNDTMLAALSTLVILIWVKVLTEQQTPTLKLVLMLGGLIGLALLVKTTALGLLPFSMLVLLIAAWRKRDWRFAMVSNTMMLAIIALISGWWFARNQILYGDPLAYRLMRISALFPRAGELTLPELFQISLPWLWQTFWGGPTPGDFSPIILVALAMLAGFALIGFTFHILRVAYSVLRVTLVILIAWLAFILVAQIQFIRTTTGADQGRYLFPAISVIALIFVLGLRECCRLIMQDARRKTNVSFVLRPLVFVIISSFFLLALFVPFAYTLPAYARPALISPNEIQNISRPMNVIFADQIELLGYEVTQRSVKPGDSLQVTLYWRALTPMQESYRVFVHLVGQDNRVAGGADVIPARGAFPTVYWKPGDALRDVIQVPIAPNAMPGKYVIEVGLYPVGKPGERLAITPSGEERVLLEAIKVAPRDQVVYNPCTRVNANFGNQIELEGYDVNIEQGTLHLVLYWRARVALNEDYTVFVHLLDANGNIIAQTDLPPQAGNYPTSIWDAGEQVRDVYTFDLPANAQRIRVGLYRADSGKRLPVMDNQNNIMDDHILFEVNR